MDHETGWRPHLYVIAGSASRAAVAELQVSVKESTCLVLIAREKVPVAVERDVIDECPM